MDSQETEEGLKRRAYALGLKPMHSNLDMETIYARLEKNGFPPDLAKQVAKDIQLERNKVNSKNQKQIENIARIRIFGGIAIIIVTALFISGYTIIPMGLIVGGIVYFIMNKKK